MNNCVLCPRECHVNRSDGECGFCGVDDTLRVARCAPHFWEEPPLSGTRGAGAIFFSGCSLRCVFCQNYELSHSAKGDAVSEDCLFNMIFSLEAQGVHCIDLVTPTHYADKLVNILRKAKPKLKIPVVWNCGGYESVETLKMLEGLVDIYLPDFKYASSEVAEKYSDASDYPRIATAALAEMYRQTGAANFNENGLMNCGVIIRHLVLPAGRYDSVNVLKLIADTVPVNNIRLSLMSQYTPDFANNAPYHELHRRVTSFEYNYVLHTAEAMGFEGYFQERSSADKKFTPAF